MRVYFAGPLFTPYERDFIDECARALRGAGIEVFVPHEHTPEMLVDGRLTAQGVFQKDLAGLMPSNAVVALLDGPMVDDGTACEIGLFYAFAQTDRSKKGILGLVTDSRVARARQEYEAKGMNLMVLGAIEAMGGVYEDIGDIIAILREWQEDLDRDGGEAR